MGIIKDRNGMDITEVDKNSRMGKTRGQENWRYQEIISCKVGTMKDRNSKDLTETEQVKKR